MPFLAYLLFLSLCLIILTDSFMQRASCGPVLLGKHFEIQTNPYGLFLSESMPTSSEAINTIVVLFDENEENAIFAEYATETANTLGVPILSAADFTARLGSENGCEFTHVLRLVPYLYGNDQSNFALAIEPVDTNSQEDKKGRRRPKRKPKKIKPSESSSAFFVDLCPPKGSRAGKRAAGASGTSDLLVKAVRPRKGLASGCNESGAIVWDLTAGLGQDSLILAMNGAGHVQMVERNPIVAALLRDAIRRLELIANCDPSPERLNQQEVATALLEKLTLTIGEGKDVLQKESAQGCDVVYLDPMFPPRQKQSAVKKGMSILHGILETHIQSVDMMDEQTKQEEEQQLLLSAIDVARLRVVVKRPIKASPLGDGSKKPSYEITGSTNRWDVYVSPPKT